MGYRKTMHGQLLQHMNTDGNKASMRTCKPLHTFQCFVSSSLS